MGGGPGLTETGSQRRCFSPLFCSLLPPPPVHWLRMGKVLAVLKPLLSSGSDCIVRVLGLVACATCSTEVLAFRSESSELFQEHGDPQKEKLNEQRWQKAQQ